MKMKKLLASALAAAMVISSMVGTLVTSAAETVGTITAGTVNAVVGETDTVAADINITFPDGVEAPHNIITVALDGYTLDSISELNVSYAEGKGPNEGKDIVDIDPDGSNLAAGRILLETAVDSKAPTVLAISFKANFVDADETDTEVGTYDIVVSGDDMTDINEADIAITAVNGSLVVEEAVVECDHANATSEVTAQPTKDAVGTMTYTCECGHTWTEEIAKPEATTAVTFKGDIVVSSVVGANITISTKQMRTAYGDAATYFINVDYLKYEDGGTYMLEDRNTVLTAADRIDDGTSTANKDVIAFTDIALYEMTLDFTMTIYFKNGDGIVVGYREFTTNIANMALAYAPTAPATLLTALADMCVYGDEAQKFFAAANPGTDICDAALPSTVLGETYMAAKSSSEGMPAAGEYNNDKGSTKIVSTTGFISAGQTLVIGASNQISYTLRYDNYDWANVEIKVYYEDSLAGLKEVTLTAEDLVANGTTGAGMPKYLYYFKDLALYDCDKTVTMDMYYNGVKELTSVYSFGNFVNANLGNDSLAPILTAMELFSNSVGVQLGLAARW